MNAARDFELGDRVRWDSADELKRVTDPGAMGPRRRVWLSPHDRGWAWATSKPVTGILVGRRTLANGRLRWFDVRGVEGRIVGAEHAIFRKYVLLTGGRRRPVLRTRTEF